MLHWTLTVVRFFSALYVATLKRKPQNYRPLTPVEYSFAWYVLLTTWIEENGWVLNLPLLLTSETTDWHLVFVSCFTLYSFGVVNWYLNFIIYKRCYIFQALFFLINLFWIKEIYINLFEYHKCVLFS